MVLLEVPPHVFRVRDWARVRRPAKDKAPVTQDSSHLTASGSAIEERIRRFHQDFDKAVQGAGKRGDSGKAQTATRRARVLFKVRQKQGLARLADSSRHGRRLRRTGLVATIDVFLGVFGYLLGVRWIGGTTILSSTVATPISWLAYWHHNATGIYSPNLVEA